MKTRSRKGHGADCRFDGPGKKLFPDYLGSMACVLPERRVTDVEVDYCCFNIPDEFVVGYGLDYAQKYRNLPYIGVVELQD